MLRNGIRLLKRNMERDKSESERQLFSKWEDEDGREGDDENKSIELGVFLRGMSSSRTSSSSLQSFSLPLPLFHLLSVKLLFEPTAAVVELWHPHFNGRSWYDEQFSLQSLR